MDTDFSSGPLDYSSAELKRNLNGYHLAHGYYFFEHESHESNESFSSGPLDYSIRTLNPCPSVSICGRIKNDPCAKNIRNSCSKKESVFVRVHPCAKNIRVIRAIRVQKNPCLSVSIRVPKIFDSCSKKIRVQKKQSAQVPHTNAEPRRTIFILSVMPGDYHSISRHDHYHYLFTSLHYLLAINNIHSMRQAADTGTCSDTSAVKGINILVS